jgi:hypothetical protein
MIAFGANAHVGADKNERRIPLGPFEQGSRIQAAYLFNAGSLKSGSRRCGKPKSISWLWATWPGRSVCRAMVNTAIGDEVVIHTMFDLMQTLDTNVLPDNQVGFEEA